MDVKIFVRLYGWFALILIIITTSFGQQAVSFKTGNFSLLPPVQDTRQSSGTQYLFFQADHVQSPEEKEDLGVNGIRILYALHNNLYWVRVSKVQDERIARRLFDIDPNYKVGIDINDRSETNRYRLSIAPNLRSEELIEWAGQNEITLLDTRASAYGFIDVDRSCFRSF